MSESISPRDLARLQKALADWFRAHRRPLPWREHYEPYGVWISEIMLQQTQMDRGVEYYNRWMERFPSLTALADADEEDVLHAWEGLGYYSRARNVLKAARVIRDRCNGVFPCEVEDLLALPGVGPYTAAAIASIAFEKDAVCVDANVERIVSRLFDLTDCVRTEPGKGRVKELARLLLPKGGARIHNQAMMELGALVCTKRPACPHCPLVSHCLALARGTVSQRPVLPARPDRILLNIATGVLLDGDRVYVQKRMPDDVWGGLWEFPGGGVEEGESPAEAVVRELMEETGFAVEAGAHLGTIHHNYTKYLVTLHCFALRLSGAGATGPTHPAPPCLKEASDFHWVTIAELADRAMPSAHRRLARALSLKTDADGRPRISCSLPDSETEPESRSRLRAGLLPGLEAD